jgi:hypothetical protein
LQLSLNAVDPDEKFLLFFCRMRHTSLISLYCTQYSTLTFGLGGRLEKFTAFLNRRRNIIQM